MSIRLEQLNVSSVSKVFVTRIELGNELFKSVSEYMNTRVQTNEGLELQHTETENGTIDTFSLKPATKDEIGGIKVGRNLSIDNESRLNVDVDLDQYHGGQGIIITNSESSDQIKIINIDKATTSKLGGIIAGEGLTITEDGVLSVVKSPATNNQLGLVKAGRGLESVDGQLNVKVTGDLHINDRGELYVNVPEIETGSKTTKGILQVGNGINVTPDGIISIPEPATASKTVKGILQVGDGIDVSNGIISVPQTPTGSKTAKGILQVGDGIDVSNGIISVPQTPTASKTVKGTVKVGDGIDVTSDGIISVPQTPTASKTVKGTVKVGDGIDVNNGIISVTIPQASTSVSGTVKVGKNLTMTNGVLSANDVVIPVGSTTTKGIVQAGTNVTIENGVLSADVSRSEINNILSMIQDLQNKHDILAREVENLSNIIGNTEGSSIVGKYGNNFMAGTIVYNGVTGGSVALPQAVTSTDYRVALLTSIPTNGSQGEIWVEDKTTSGFNIKTSGSMISTRCDWVIFMNESSTSSYNGSTFPYQRGKATMNGQTGVNVTLPQGMGGTDYAVVITALNSPLGTFGEVWIENKTATGFTIKSSGTTNTEVEYFVVKYGKNAFNADTAPIQAGSGTFNGISDVTVQLPRSLSNSSYQVLLGLEGNPEGSLGDFYVYDKTPDSFKVSTTGETTSKFNYIVVGK